MRGCIFFLKNRECILSIQSSVHLSARYGEALYIIGFIIREKYGVIVFLQISEITDIFRT